MISFLVLAGCPTDSSSDTSDEKEQDKETTPGPGPGPGPSPAPEATGVKILEGRSVAVLVDGTIALHAVVSPSGASQSVTWVSDNEATATVEGGVVTGVEAGKEPAVITAKTANGKTASIIVTVAPEDSPGGYFDAKGNFTPLAEAATFSAILTAVSGKDDPITVEVFDTAIFGTAAVLAFIDSDPESITIRDTRTLEEKAEDPIAVGFDIGREKVTLEGLYFEPGTNKVDNVNDSYGVLVHAENTVIKDCTIKFDPAAFTGTDNQLIGIMIHDSAADYDYKTVKIIGNTFDLSGVSYPDDADMFAAIYTAATPSKYPVIQDNIFRNVVTGVAFEFHQTTNPSKNYAGLIKALTGNTIEYVDEELADSGNGYWQTRSLYWFWLYTNSTDDLTISTDDESKLYPVPAGFGGKAGAETGTTIASLFSPLSTQGDVIVKIGGGSGIDYSDKAYEKYPKAGQTQMWNFTSTSTAATTLGNKWEPKTQP
jgi:hypothetical protein